MTRPKDAVVLRVAACLLGAGCVVWAAAPLVARGLADWALALAILGVAAGTLRLAVARIPVPEDNWLLPTTARAVIRVLEVLRSVPWEEGALLAIVWLELLHSSRPGLLALGAAALTEPRCPDQAAQAGR